MGETLGRSKMKAQTGALVEFIEGTRKQLPKDYYAKLPGLGETGKDILVSRQVELTPANVRKASGLYVTTALRARTPLAGICDLYLSYESRVERETARFFSGLCNLWVGSKEATGMSWFGEAPLTGLSIRDSATDELEVLRRKAIKILRVEWSQKQLTYLPPTLESLSLMRLGPLAERDLEPVWACSSIERLKLTNLELKTLRKVSTLPSVTELIVSPKTFDGISECRRIRSLVARFPGICAPVSEVASTGTLRTLTLRARRPPVDLNAIGKLDRLEHLNLAFGDIHSSAELPSLAFIRSMSRLRSLRLTGVNLLDKSLKALAEVRSLKSLHLVGDFGGSVDHRGGYLKGRDVRIVDKPARHSAKEGELVRVTSRDGHWTIFQDLSVPLKMKSNHDVEAVIRERLSAIAPQVARTVTFDSEADSFSAVSRSRRGIDAVAEIVREMAAPSRARKKRSAGRAG